MRKLNSILVLAALATAPATAMSQELAAAPAAIVSDHMVFMENGTRVPASALETIRKAANAAQSAPVWIEGRADQVNAVKQELVQQGAPAEAITVRAKSPTPLATTGDGVPDVTERRVDIKF